MDNIFYIWLVGAGVIFIMARKQYSDLGVGVFLALIWPLFVPMMLWIGIRSLLKRGE